MQELAGRQSLGTVDEMEIATDLHLRGALQGRPDDGLHRPGSEGRLDRHEGTALEMRTDAGNRRLQSLVRRIAGRRLDWSFDADRDDLCVRAVGWIEARVEFSFGNRRLDELVQSRLSTAKRAATGVDRFDLFRIDVDAHDVGAGRRDRGRERHANVAEADHRDLHGRAHDASFG